jgi:hypothetical protein
MEALRRRFHGDTACIEVGCKLNLCILCVARKGSAAHGVKLRHDCISDELVCMNCGPGSVVSIGMVGCVVSVANREQLLISTCCGAVIRYSGHGAACSCCGPHCASAHQLFGKRDATTRALPPRTCFVCGQRCGAQQQTLQLLDVRQRCIQSYALCSKHTVPGHVSGSIYDTDTLLLYFQRRLNG